MLCRYCASELKVGTHRCPFCGREVEEFFTPKTEIKNVYNVLANLAQTAGKSKKKNKPVKIILPVVAGVISVTIAMSIMAAGAGGRDYEEYKEETVASTVQYMAEKEVVEEVDEEVVFVNYGEGEKIAEVSFVNESVPKQPIKTADSEKTTKTEIVAEKEQIAAPEKQKVEFSGIASYIGKTYSDVFSAYGTDFETHYINGGNFVKLQTENSPVFFGALPGCMENPTVDEIKKDTITSLFALKGAHVYKDFYVGMSYSQLKNIVPDIEEVGFDEMEEVYHAGFEYDGYYISYTWPENPGDDMESTSVFVAKR